MSILQKNDKYQKIFEIGNKLDEIQDIDVLLERILTETRKIVNADAGSIYRVEKKNNKEVLAIKYGQNDTRLKDLEPGTKLPYTYFTFDISEQQICGYVALTKQALNIDDCYKIPEDKPYKFNPITDVTTCYRTTSMFTVPLTLSNGRLLGILQIINAKDKKGNIISFNQESQEFILYFANLAAKTLKRAYDTHNNIKRMLKMAELRDPKETYCHVTRVSSFAREIYDRYAFTHNIDIDERATFLDALSYAAQLHDVGKVGISDTILKKPGPFTDEERNIMKGHTCMGGKLFEPVDSFLDKMCQDVAMYHHCRWDGGERGYPGKINLDDFSTKTGIVPESEPLKGEEIPLAARIVAVADVFDALSHARCYKKPWTIEDTIAEIQNSSGTQFDPEVVEAFMQIKDRLCSILNAIPDELD